MNIAYIEKKIREASVALANMAEHERSASNDHGLFDSYLSAFLSAGISARNGFHVRQDRKRNDAITAWCKAWAAKLSREQKTLFDFMGQVRNDEVHGGNPRLIITIEDRELGYGTHKLASATMHIMGAPNLASVATMRVPAYKFAIAGAERKATEACAAYFILMERMFADFKAESFLTGEKNPPG